MKSEYTIVEVLFRDDISPKAAAFIFHALIEMTYFDEEGRKEFKNHILELFNLDVNNELT